MTIGIFDSGLGGLRIAHHLINSLPNYSMHYLGDTARVPYGDRPQTEIFAYTLQAVDYLFSQDCALVIIACNTASAEALRRLQRDYLPRRYPDRRILGVLIPAAEAAVAATQDGQIGVIATRTTIQSKAYDREIQKLRPTCQVLSQTASLLVPLIESDALEFAAPVIEQYLKPLAHLDTIILGCTHYPYLAHHIQAYLGPRTTIVSPDKILGPKLSDYLTRHPEIRQKLSPANDHRFEVTSLNPVTQVVADRLFGSPLRLTAIKPFPDNTMPNKPRH